MSVAYILALEKMLIELSIPLPEREPDAARVHQLPDPTQLQDGPTYMVKAGIKPVCYLRTRYGKPDWAEDCVSADSDSLEETYSESEGYGVMPLYARPPRVGEPVAQRPQPFQARVAPWMQECFGPAVSADIQERNHRFIEEALEAVQASGATRSECHQLVDYVYGRPTGELGQEVGGVMVTLAALCLARGIDMHECGERELARVWTCVEKIRAKQAAKPKHSPLPESAPKLNMQEPMPSELEMLTVEHDNLRRCVEWYAGGNHFSLNDWENPEGGSEACWLCPPPEIEGIEPFDPQNPVDISKRPRHTVDLDAPWMVEDGSVARAVLAGGQMNTDPADEETIVHAAPSIAHERKPA